MVSKSNRTAPAKGWALADDCIGSPQPQTEQAQAAGTDKNKNKKNNHENFGI
jgi:hypothetical protein